MSEDIDRIKESLPEGWELTYSIESFGRFGVRGVAILIRLPEPGQLSEETKSIVSDQANLLSEQMRKDIIQSQPDYEKKKAEEKKALLACFKMSPIYAEEIPNEYWLSDSPEALASPWHRVTTHIGRVKIGWRKRVIVIDWSETQVKTFAEELFPDENVTRDGCLIHAWSHEKATEYLKRLFRPPEPMIPPICWGVSEDAT